MALQAAAEERGFGGDHPFPRGEVGAGPDIPGAEPGGERGAGGCAGRGFGRDGISGGRRGDSKAAQGQAAKL